jgi:isopentenyl diphosphate isomerase/L-lactate dehydrogenase-like FMN-dependent dehydrogenase
MSNGGEDGGTIRANREGFEHYQIRARRLVDVSRTDMSVTLFGKTWETPIFLCPVSGHRMYNPQGEVATARAAQSKKHLQMLSTMTTTPVEEVNAARGEPVWFQLYTRPEWSQTRELVKRVEAAGCPALVFTVDLLGGRNTEMFTRVQQRNQQQCGACHKGPPLTDLTNRPMVNALTANTSAKPEIGTPTWDYIKRLRDTTGMKLLVKGIVTREDAELAMTHGVDGVFVSNHGGGQHVARAIDCVPKRYRVKGRAPVFVTAASARRRYLQGAGARRDRRRCRTAVYLGAHGVRTGRRGDGPRHPASRAAAHDAAVRRHVHQGHHQKPHRRLAWLAVEGVGGRAAARAASTVTDSRVVAGCPCSPGNSTFDIAAR